MFFFFAKYFFKAGSRIEFQRKVFIRFLWQIELVWPHLIQSTRKKAPDVKWKQK